MNQSYRAHLFICTNKKDGKTCCAQRDAERFRKEVKDLAKEKWGKSVRVNASGCLDRCDEGIAAVLYPKGEWFTGLRNTEEDCDRMIEAIESALES